MKDKFVVEYRKENDVVYSHYICKSYREIVKVTGESYTDIRAIHMMGNGTMTKKFLHTKLRKLKGKMRILDI
jgi:hypothetical protein